VLLRRDLNCSKREELDVDGVVMRERVCVFVLLRDWVDGVVGRARSCSKRDWRWVRDGLDVDGFVGVGDGDVIRERSRVFALLLDCLEGVVLERGWFTDVLVDSLPIRVPMRLRDWEASGLGVVVEGLL